MSLLMILLTIFLPPVAVAIKEGIGLQFLLNVLLTLATLRLKPGEAHAPAAALAACEFILSADAAPLEPSARQLELAARKWREARAVLVWQKTDAQLAALVDAIC